MMEINLKEEFIDDLWELHSVGDRNTHLTSTLSQSNYHLFSVSTHSLRRPRMKRPVYYVLVG
jgi:hypothetical protein